jgi:hypothetical protein
MVCACGRRKEITNSPAGGRMGETVSLVASPVQPSPGSNPGRGM